MQCCSLAMDGAVCFLIFTAVALTAASPTSEMFSPNPAIWERPVTSTQGCLLSVWLKNKTSASLSRGLPSYGSVRMMSRVNSDCGSAKANVRGYAPRLRPRRGNLGRVRRSEKQTLPDSIAGLESLEEFYLSSNQLESLPDSIGLLLKLKILDISSNQLKALPDSISECRSLVELDAGYNALAYLPTNIGYGLVNLLRLCVQYNKLRYLPSSVCEMKSLRYLDAHFNELRGLPYAIGRLTSLEVLNLGSNFSDLKELPETFGDLMSLKELDLSNNQIHALPNTFGRLDNLTKLNLDQNPIVIPPMEVVKDGAYTVKEYMVKRWLDILAEEEQRGKAAEDDLAQTGWLKRSTSLLTRSTSMLKDVASTVSENFTDYLAGGKKPPMEPYLDQQL